MTVLATAWRAPSRLIRRTGSIARAIAVLAQPAALRGITPAAALAAVREMRGSRPGPHSTVRLHAILHPARTAIVDERRRLDWRGFDREVGALAAGLVELGVRAGDRVALVLPNVIEHVVAQQALMRNGATALQISNRLTAPEIAYMLDDATPSVIIYHEHYADEVRAAHARAGSSARLVVVGTRVKDCTYDDVIRAGEARGPASTADAGASGLMIYTSGTTGRPKGARRTYRSGYEPVFDFMRRLRMSPRDRHLVVCPLYHTGGFGFVAMMNALGATTYLMERFEPEEVLRFLARERITSAFFVPTMLTRLLALGDAILDRYDTSSLRWVASGAAPLPTDVARRFQSRFGPILWNFYGATETGVVTLAGPADHATRAGTIGRALRGNQVALLDARGREVPIGEVGELYVRSPMLVGGYHGNTRATAASMRDGAFSVGDLARRDADGFFYLEARKSDMIISGGVNIYPREIEERLLEHPDVQDCAVVGVPDDEWGESVAAFVVARSGATVDADAIAGHCRGHLAGFKCPRRIELVAELPRNDTGKVLKRVLRDRLRP